MARFRSLTPGLALAFTLVAGIIPAGAKTGTQEDKLPRLSQLTKSIEAHHGLLSFYLDRQAGKVWLKLPAPAEQGLAGEFLYVEGLVTGLGSNPVGLDRGQLGETRLIRLRRLGGRVVVEQVNLGFRALSRDEHEERAVRQSFATSVLWGAPVAALDEDGSSLVDFTSFLLRDAHGVVRRLARSGQGHWTLDDERSALDPDACLAFPDNLEFEALLTYGASEAGDEVRRVAPQATSFSLVQHHSLIRLPPPGYRPRRYDPRAGSFGIRFLDLAAPLTAPVETRWIARHRLEKVNPRTARSPAKQPIVYYVDRAAPEPVRTALVEGASWWRQAFEEAGFQDAYRVEILPEDVHPLDVRYNVIQWVHRSTRGWSYGGGVINPRTGEQLKAHVSLGSQRVRQDRLLFEGLAGTEHTGSGAADDPVEMALRRIRQLSAHEVGHTLGLAHNFAASSFAGRASVMDYPAPLVGIDAEGELDFSQVYGEGVGVWDRLAIVYAYSEVPPEVEEGPTLEAIIHEGLLRGYLYLSDADARPAGAAHPLANLWDNGSDPVAALEEVLEVRRIALARFDERRVLPGTPLARLGTVLAPVYFHHRYQLEATAKTLGGLEYTYAVRDDGQPPARPVDGPRQRRALETMLGILRPEALDLPEAILELMLPSGQDDDARGERMHGFTSPAFDPLAAAATAADMVVDVLLEPHRAARLVDHHRRDRSLPGLDELLASLIEGAFGAGTLEPREAELQRVIQTSVVSGMLQLASNTQAAPWVRARVETRLETLEARLREARPSDTDDAAQARFLRRRIRRFLERTQQDPADRERAPGPPPGSPIGNMPPPGLAGCSFGP